MALGIPRATVHMDIMRLEYIDPSLHKQVRPIIDYNHAMKASRGGRISRRGGKNGSSSTAMQG